MSGDLATTLRHLRDGRPVLLYDADGREEETDMVVPSQHVTPETIRTLRRDAGGLLCTTVAPEDHDRLGLPYLSDLIQGAADDHPVLRTLLPDDIQYDGTKPAFGLTINHRSTYTGITDEDRATTISELARFLDHTRGEPRSHVRTAFGKAFRAPGHVILLNGAPGGLAARQGHTELSTELMRQAGLVPSATLCEMMDPDSGKALSQKGAREYAKRHGLVFLMGSEVLQAWRTSDTTPRPVPTSA